MGILDDDVARVRDATDLVALAGEHLALKRVGKRFIGLCPFHAEKTPSFNVNPEIGRYSCFGCQANGDAISFVREVEHLDFVDAVERLARARGHHAPLRRQVGHEGQGSQGAPQRSGRRRDRLLRAAAARVARRRHCSQVSARARLQRRRGAPVQARLVTRRLGPRECPPAASEVLAHRHRRRRSRVREQGEQAAGPVPRSSHVPDLRQQGRTGRLRRARARRRRPEVQELTRDLDLPEEPLALRAQLGQGRGRGPRADPHLRGLHRRDGVRALR